MAQAVNYNNLTRFYSFLCFVFWSLFTILMLQNSLEHSLVECNQEQNTTQHFENQIEETHALFNISNGTEPDEIAKIENEFNLLNTKEIAAKWVQIKNDLNRTFNFSYLNANTSESSNQSISADVQIKLQKKVDNKEFLKRLNQSQRFVGKYQFNKSSSEQDHSLEEFNFSNNETNIDKANETRIYSKYIYDLKYNSTENDLEGLIESASSESNPKVFKEDTSETVNMNDSFESIELETSSSELSNDIEVTNPNQTSNTNRTFTLDSDYVLFTTTSTSTSSTSEDINLTTASGFTETSSISASQNSTTITRPESISENPQFLECITLCGTDHDCVRTKCLLDSTYFG